MLVITASRVLPDADAAAIDDAAIVVRGDRISDVLPRTSEAVQSALRSSEALHVDWSGRTVVPGFVDAHLHITTRGAGRLHDETGHDPEAALENGAANLASALGWGVTTVRDAGSWDDEVLTLRDQTASGKLIGPRVLPAGAPLTTPGGHLHWFGGEADGVAAVGTFVRRQAERGMTHVKVMATGGWATPGSDPRLPQYSTLELYRAASEARSLGMHTMAHIASTEGVRRSIDAGIDTLEHVMFQRPDGSWEYPDELLDQIVRRRAWVDPTPAWHYRTVQRPPLGISADRLDALRRARTARMEVYRKLVARGHDRWLIGTDTGGTNPRDLFPLVCEIMVMEIGLTPRDVLRAATSAAAQAFAVEGETGTLRRGMAADIVAVDGDPTEDVGAYWRIRGVVARGRLVDVIPDHSSLDASVGGGWE